MASMRIGIAIVVLGLTGMAAVTGGAQPQEPVTIRVDTAARKGPMYPFWAWFGHDEPNYTYTPNGMKLLSALQDAQPRARVHARAQPADVGRRQARAQVGLDQRLHRGRQRAIPSTTGRSSIGSSTPTWTRGMKPFVQLGFMPEALSSAPAGMPVPALLEAGRSVQRHLHRLDLRAEGLQEVGRALLSGDAAPRREVRPQEVESWWFELWNEPDIGYWSGSVGPSGGRGDPLAAQKAQTRRDEFNKLYDFTVEGVRRALPTARIGGPEVTGGAQAMLRTFLQHTSAGTNYATGKIGTPLDLITFHAKGSPTFVENRVRMGVANQLRSIDNHFAVVKRVPDVREDAARHRRVRSRGLRGVRRHATIRRTAIATARCSRPTRRCRSRARTNWPTCTR